MVRGDDDWQKEDLLSFVREYCGVNGERGRDKGTDQEIRKVPESKEARFKCGKNKNNEVQDGRGKNEQSRVEIERKGGGKSEGFQVSEI